MPEFYVEPMKDRRTCFKCKLTGKKRLLTCNNCHAITYCGEECARSDWDRHNWNCVPVMIKEFPGKGQGIVAATDIKMGKRIFKDKPVIKLVLNAYELPVDPDFMVSLKKQIENLPAEAKLQFYKLTTSTRANTYHIKIFGSIPEKRKTAMKRYIGFECNFPVCLGQVWSQEKILKKLIELHQKLDPYVDTSTVWKREAGICYKIVDLAMGLLIGGTNEKMVALTKSAVTAHLARDKDLVMKVMDKYEKYVEETKVDHMQRCFKIFERRLSQLSTEFNSGKAPEMEESDSLTSRMTEMDINPMHADVD